MSYKQRLLRFHHHFSTFAEDMFASSICIPFTLLLYLFSILNGTRLFSYIPSKVRDWLFLGIKEICMFPARCLTGLASILITPLALICALLSVPPLKYTYSGLATGIGGGILALSLVVKMIFWSLTVQWGFILPLVWVPSFFLLYRSNSRLLLAGALLMFGINAIGALPSIITFSAGILYAPLTLPLWLLGSLCLFSWPEGKYQFFTSQLANAINFLILRTQFILMRFNRYPFKNKQSNITLTEIKNIPSKDLFISHSNHAFILSEFEENIDFALLHWYENAEPFEPDDFLALEQHSQLYRFPKLKEFIKLNRDEYLKKLDISKESLIVLHEFGKALGQNPASPDFNANLVKAQEALDKQLAKISPAQRTAIENLKLNDKDTFKSMLTKVAKGAHAGGECKGFASSYIIKAVARIENRNNDEENPPFYRSSLNGRSAAGIGHYGDYN